MLANPAGAVGLLIVTALVLLSFVGPLLVPAANTARVGQVYQSPSRQHILGTDFQGRDNLVLAIHGGRDVIAIAVLAGALTTLIAVAVGASSASLAAWSTRC